LLAVADLYIRARPFESEASPVRDGRATQVQPPQAGQLGQIVHAFVTNQGVAQMEKFKLRETQQVLDA
jgi:hypothetical protein